MRKRGKKEEEEKNQRASRPILFLPLGKNEKVTKDLNLSVKNK